MTKKTILVIDDSPDMLALYGTILSGTYRVRMARTAEDALAAVKSAPCADLILLDVMMPDVDGYELLAKMRDAAQDRLESTPVIFVSGMTSGLEEEQALRLGAVDFIAKPVRPAVLHARLRLHLELKEARDRLREQNDHLEIEIERRMAENDLIKEVSLQALAMMSETRDFESGGHLQRTQYYVCVLAQRLAAHPRYESRLNPDWIRMVTKAALLHDLGKVGIPDTILFKEGKLTPEEFEVMKTHTYLGSYAIQSAIRRVASDYGIDGENASAHPALAFLEIASEIALTHHEKWDGSGYPYGLSGDDIPLSGQLMAIADVYDALLSKRVYKKPMAEEDVIRIIEEGRGKHFNPDLVDALLASREAMRAIAARYADRKQSSQQSSQ